LFDGNQAGWSLYILMVTERPDVREQNLDCSKQSGELFRGGEGFDWAVGLEHY
jgi:hypothetical protein